jgi:hypothetical protein
MATRERVLARDGHLCQCDDCARIEIPLEADQVDHKVPLWEGGQDVDENLWALNAECHKRKTKAEAARRAAASLVSPEPADSPLGFLLGVMNDEEQDPRLRVRAAIAAAQYKHAKVGEGGKKDAKQGAADVVAGGKFAAAAPPKLVVNNR